MIRMELTIDVPNITPDTEEKLRMVLRTATLPFVFAAVDQTPVMKLGSKTENCLRHQDAVVDGSITIVQKATA